MRKQNSNREIRLPGRFATQLLINSFFFFKVKWPINEIWRIVITFLLSFMFPLVFAAASPLYSIEFNWFHSSLLNFRLLSCLIDFKFPLATQDKFFCHIFYILYSITFFFFFHHELFMAFALYVIFCRA